MSAISIFHPIGVVLSSLCCVFNTCNMTRYNLLVKGMKPNLLVPLWGCGRHEGSIQVSVRQEVVQRVPVGMRVLKSISVVLRFLRGSKLPRGYLGLWEA